MATVLRIKGQEVQVRITRNGVLDRTIVDIKSATVVGKFTKIFEKYLGRSSDDTDDIFDHVEGTLVVNPRSQDILNLAMAIKQRAQRNVSQDLLKINFVATLQFPNGQKPKIIVPDLKFGDIPVNFPGREQYVDVPFDWGADDYDVLLS